MNIFTFLFIAILAPPLLGMRWLLIRCGIKDPSDGQVYLALFALFLAAFWISGIWLAPAS